MESSGDSFDNVLYDGFFAAPKCGLLARFVFRTRAEARRAVVQFIEGW